ncbi:SDR family oxidoreductase [Gillisia limnaea]|uniref:Short-chain dehydrogenase/reductase SDR n=1 Tax=Gillisia limnaea (strain DSM 15749 / LMG 21470 / R-8282) TaxID=865937 RepID=H2BZJ2_GILLR|nr:SDR family oxidoreductase [Gillisia limnaea]EHQ03401.1 short-chain dehydrogenase/reductase SDR [Gillisia limnaea DSM 15749]
MWNLNGQTAIVTGGTKGIGKATVLEFLDLGARVLFTARNKQDVESLEKELQNKGFEVNGIVSDVSVKVDRQKIVNWIQNNWQTLDILVNNAGINIRKEALEYSEDELKKVLDINLVAPFELSRALHPFLERSKVATVINIASVAALQDVGTGTPYAMAKSGLLQQTRSLAVEWAQDGIRVNAVSPWFTETPLTEGFLKQDEKMNGILGRTPLKRIAKAEEMASIIAFLAMEKSSYITGQNIIADGGMSINAI